MSAESLSIIDKGSYIEICDDKDIKEREKKKIKNLLIGATGSVASIKIPLLVKSLLELDSNLSIKVCVTTHASHFFDPNTLNLETGVQVFTDQDEWKDWNKISDPILHIELRNWADAFILAPLDANTLAKIANGLCDNLITCVLRAWDFTKPVIVCPAMNTNMWNHPFTAKHLKVLVEELGYIVVPPISKKLACGDLGVGAMAEYVTIVNYVRENLI
ncbi:10009_t:CDS:2 [Ambispora leptoticha]|uniref:10009_t:CDS:1 n=1 Tax=Ambispora leptoticha TaxID=144679 RepID=A0A9N8VD47_9GLOM|nr:10009_t:CDS:2 [Ambispora leptoticha]